MTRKKEQAIYREKVQKSKEIFHAFHYPKFDKKMYLDETTLVMLDTNFFLDILRKPTPQSEKYIKSIQELKAKKFVSFFSATEFNYNKKAVKEVFARNHINNINTKIKTMLNQLNYVDISKSNDKSETEQNKPIDYLDIETIFNSDEELTLNHLYHDEIKTINTLKKDLQDKIEIISENIKKDFIKERDLIYEKTLTELYINMANKPEQEFIDKIEEEGVERYEKEMPPGYDDNNKQEYKNIADLTFNSIFADLLIWKDLIEHSKNLNIKRVIWVTNDGTADKKSDLIKKIEGIKVGPKLDLINELYAETKYDFYIQRNDQFVSDVLNDTSIKNNKTEILNDSDYRGIWKFDFSQNKTINNDIDLKNYNNEYSINSNLINDDLNNYIIKSQNQKEIENLQKEITKVKKEILKDRNIINNPDNQTTLIKNTEFTNRLIKRIKYNKEQLVKLNKQLQMLELENELQ